MAKKEDKKKKRGGQLVRYRGGFVPAKPTWGQVRKVAERIAKDTLKDSGVDIDRVTGMLKGAKLPSATQLGSKIAGTVYSVAQDYVSGSSAGSQPFLETNTVGTRSIGSSITRKHKTVFQHGKVTPRALRTCARLNGTTIVPFLDTQRSTTYQSGSTGRDHLTANAGFNRKLIACWSPMQWTLSDIYTVGNFSNYSSPKTKLQRNYLAATELWRKVKIHNTSRYLKATYKIKLLVPKTHSTPTASNLAAAFYNDSELTAGVQLNDRAPIRYVLDNFVNEGSEGAFKTFVDPKVGYECAPRLRALYDTVRTFTKTLGPGDIWDFNETMYTGGGLNLDELVYQHSRYAEAEVGHVLLIEAVGQEVAACYAPISNENMIGRAPLYFQVEFSKGAKFINAPHASQSGFTTSSNGGVVSTNFMIRSFTTYGNQEANSTKIFNVPISNITDDPTDTVNGKLFIPIMSDSTVQYAQRARENGTGGNEN